MGGSGKGVGTSEGWWVGGGGRGGAMFTVLVQPNCSRFLSTVTTHSKEKERSQSAQKKGPVFFPLPTTGDRYTADVQTVALPSNCGRQSLRQSLSLHARPSPPAPRPAFASWLPDT